MSIENSDPLDVRALQAFQAVMASGSMTAAARRLGVGQPTVTRLIRDLENEVGFECFHRNGPRISPTERGLRFYEDVQRLMANFRQIRERASAIREERVPAIDIVATPTMAGGLIGSALARLGATLPDIVNVQTMDAEHVVSSLRNRRADFGASALPLDHAELTCHFRCDARLVAITAAGSPFSGGPFALRDLNRLRLVTVGNVYRVRRTIDEALEMQDIHPKAEFLTNSSLNAVMAARAGLGVAIVDPVTAFGIPVAGVEVLPLDTEIKYSWGLFSPENRDESELQRSFVEAVRLASEDIKSCLSVLHCADPAKG